MNQDIESEIKSFKYQASKLHFEFPSCSRIAVLQIHYDFHLIESYPNIHMVLRIFSTLPVTVTSNERSFSKLTLIKTYLSSTMRQMWVTSPAKLSTEDEVAKAIWFKQYDRWFCKRNARRQKCSLYLKELYLIVNLYNIFYKTTKLLHFLLVHFIFYI